MAADPPVPPPFGRRTFFALTWGVVGNALTGCRALPALATRFRHGVASADPSPTAVTLWTHVADATGDTPVRLVLADDEGLTDIVATREVVATAARDFTVEVRVDGLDAGRTYFYGFEADGELSPVGRTRTARARTRESVPVRFAFTCCASYAHGFFHTYRRIAERDDLDAVVHLGDYIYEYGDGVYGDLRGYEPPTECVSLSDYRRRYAHYRLDPDLALLHAAHPMVVTWDDHELANNAWQGGAIEHQPDIEGDWATRREAATRAHREWLPRETSHEGSLFRILSFGDVDLFVLDTRLEGRSAPPPRSAAEAAAEGRSLLGSPQRERFLDGLRASTAHWKVVAQSVQLSPHHHDFWNHDAFDGFSDERRVILETIRDEGIENVLFVCGDGHKSFADDLPLDPFDASTYDPATGTGSIATELMTPAASSPNAFGVAARESEASILEGSPHTRFVEAESRGYWVVELDEARALAELTFVDGIENPSGGDERVGARFEVRSGERHLRRLD